MPLKKSRKSRSTKSKAKSRATKSKAKRRSTRRRSRSKKGRSTSVPKCTHFDFVGHFVTHVEHIKSDAKNCPLIKSLTAADIREIEKAAQEDDYISEYFPKKVTKTQLAKILQDKASEEDIEFLLSESDVYAKYISSIAKKLAKRSGDTFSYDEDGQIFYGIVGITGNGTKHVILGGVVGRKPKLGAAYKKTCS